MDRAKPPRRQCKWFLLCANEATDTVRHPILGDVPICAHCLAIYEAQQ